MSLKVFDLQCDHGHVFEGWFASHDAFNDQQARGLLSCPVCNSHAVERKLSAPRLNVSHLRAAKVSASTGQAGAGSQGGHAQAVQSAPDHPTEPVVPSEQFAQLQAQVLQHLRAMVRSSENVGARFADEARLIHQGQAPDRAIRGVATPQECQELLEEGIAALPVPDLLDDDRLH